LDVLDAEVVERAGAAAEENRHEMHRYPVDQAGGDDLLPVTLVVAECPFMQVAARRNREVRPGCGRLQS
jgi:hypothetical protein